MLFSRTIAALLVVAAPALALSHKGVKGGRAEELVGRDVSVCAEGLFFWPVKGICLNIGGRAAPSYPPAGKTCPSEWQYHSGYSCCVPTHAQAPTPSQGSTCSNGWPWSSQDLCCNEPSPRSNPPPSPPQNQPVPSGRFHAAGQGGHNKLRRAGRRDAASLACPAGLKACSIGFHNGDFECVDPLQDLTSCGGCVAPGDVGQDCTTIANTKSVGCNAGKCEVYECLPGFTFTADGSACVKA